MAQKTWFITGAGRGFGRQFAEAALRRGDNVAATARDVSALADLHDEFGSALLPLALDVTDHAAVERVVGEAWDAFDGLDIVVNNAGFGLFGMIEELTDEQLRHQFEVNVFGPFWVVQAVLPRMREQGSGHIIQISSVGGVVAFPNLGGYNASKWALEAMSEALAEEVRDFGITVTIVEPAGYDTDWRGNSAVRAASHPAYDGARERAAANWASQPAEWTGDPSAAGPAMLRLVDAAEPPLRVFFGTGPTQFIPQVYERKLAQWREWEELSRFANG